MIKPFAQLFAGALVLGVSSTLPAGPVQLDSERSKTAAPKPRQYAADVVIERSGSDDLAFHAVDLTPRVTPSETSGGNVTYYVVDSASRTTLAVPLPPAVWPAGVTLGVVAIGTILRQHRRK